MRFITFVLMSLCAIHANAEVINTNNRQVRGTYPARVGGIQNPTIEQLREAGWREYVPCASIAGSNAVVVSHTDDGVTYTETCDYAAIPPAQPYADLDQQLDQLWPLLADHPAPADVPVDGMTYRLDGDPITWWIVRRSDLIATQLSAHDKDGNPIVRTVNLLTGEDETINLRQMVNARNFNDLNSAAKRSTNAAIKARAGR